MLASYLLEMWVKPRETIRKIKKDNPKVGLKLLSWFLGCLLLFNIFQIYSVSVRLSFPILLLSLFILAPLVGYLYLSLSAWFLTVCGKWIKGKGKFQEIRAALAWSSVPLIASVLLWFILLGFFGKGLFAHFPANLNLSMLEIYLVMGITLVQLGFSLWAMILYLYSLAEIQQFSISQAIINTIIAFIAVLAIFFILWLVTIYIWVYLM